MWGSATSCARSLDYLDCVGFHPDLPTYILHKPSTPSALLFNHLRLIPPAQVPPQLLLGRSIQLHSPHSDRHLNIAIHHSSPIAMNPNHHGQPAPQTLQHEFQMVLALYDQFRQSTPGAMNGPLPAGLLNGLNVQVAAALQTHHHQQQLRHQQQQHQLRQQQHQQHQHQQQQQQQQQQHQQHTNHTQQQHQHQQNNNTINININNINNINKFHISSSNISSINNNKYNNNNKHNNSNNSCNHNTHLAHWALPSKRLSSIRILK
ncbi:hypothetical protein PGT21_000221 [Puccinia graminis f. sp. tritici]|uniref:Uncharacterized protein n=1 Tax=Puccinia graminis f. sp. tritici TaxID=56615 RepID=A0A5B0MNT9_PUCGR|nr:hypothetical protein PGT21_000221 [Puccinia graminis f. sp. tritici]